MRLLSVFLLAVLSLPVFSQSFAADPLVSKLVEGSPWRFVTDYENTVHEFRLAETGALQRKSSGREGAWVEVKILPNHVIEYKTIRGHTITFYLDRDGNATATHSKHPSQFKSIRD